MSVFEVVYTSMYVGWEDHKQNTGDILHRLDSGGLVLLGIPRSRNLSRLSSMIPDWLAGWLSTPHHT